MKYLAQGYTGLLILDPVLNLPAFKDLIGPHWVMLSSQSNAAYQIKTYTYKT